MMEFQQIIPKLPIPHILRHLQLHSIFWPHPNIPLQPSPSLHHQLSHQNLPIFLPSHPHNHSGIYHSITHHHSTTHKSQLNHPPQLDHPQLDHRPATTPQSPTPQQHYFQPHTQPPYRFTIATKFTAQSLSQLRTPYQLQTLSHSQLQTLSPSPLQTYKTYKGPDTPSCSQPPLKCNVINNNFHFSFPDSGFY